MKQMYVHLLQELYTCIHKTNIFASGIFLSTQYVIVFIQCSVYTLMSEDLVSTAHDVLSPIVIV